jgi:hypothetical protein
MSPSGSNTARGPRRWLIATLIAAAGVVAAPAWCSPAPGGDRLPAVGAASAAAPLAAFVDPAWRWLRQLWLGLPWPISGSGGPAPSSRPKANPAGRRHVNAASRVPGISGSGDHGCRGDGDCDDDPGHGGDPDG